MPSKTDPLAQREWLRLRLAKDKLLVLPGAFDALSAKLIEREGFEALYGSGYAAVASAHGLPDLGIVGYAEMFAIYERLRAATDLPMIVDADTGYGGPLNVARTVSALSELGVSALQIEDQVNPKKCGHLIRKVVLPPAEAELRVRIAVNAAGEHGPLIIARVDALEPEGLSAAIDRANRYRQTGASITLIDAPQNLRQLEAIRAGVEGPLMLNGARAGFGVSVSLRRVVELGYDIVIYPIEPLYSAVGAVTDLLRRLHSDEAMPLGGRWQFPDFDDVNSVLGLQDMLDWEQRLSTDGKP